MDRENLNQKTSKILKIINYRSCLPKWRQIVTLRALNSMDISICLKHFTCYYTNTKIILIKKKAVEERKLTIICEETLFFTLHPGCCQLMLHVCFKEVFSSLASLLKK